MRRKIQLTARLGESLGAMVGLTAHYADVQFTADIRPMADTTSRIEQLNLAIAYGEAVLKLLGNLRDEAMEHGRNK